MVPKDYIELSNPGTMTGLLTIMDEVPVFFPESDMVGYDVEVTPEVNLTALFAAIDQKVTLTVKSRWCAGMIAPQLGYLVISEVKIA